ncbi:MAG: hypothetical protein HC915_21395 [Anaerolineae bacterium]|nr:hypothetical protein [Anaerolineae bacterium]
MARPTWLILLTRRCWPTWNASAGLTPGRDARTQGALFINEYSWFVCGPAIGAFLLAQEVPDLAPENVALCAQTYTWHEDGASGEAERLAVRFLSMRCGRLGGQVPPGQAAGIALADAWMFWDIYKIYYNEELSAQKLRELLNRAGIIVDYRGSVIQLWCSTYQPISHQ